MTAQAKVIRVHNDLPLRMHATPFLEGRVISKLPVGTIVDIEGVEGAWMCVHDRATGHTGWVDRKYVQELPPPQPDALKIDPPDIELVDFYHKAWAVVFGVLAFAAVVVLALFGVIG